MPGINSRELSHKDKTTQKSKIRCFDRVTGIGECISGFLPMVSGHHPSRVIVHKCYTLEVAIASPYQGIYRDHMVPKSPCISFVIRTGIPLEFLAQIPLDHLPHRILPAHLLILLKVIIDLHDILLGMGCHQFLINLLDR